MGTATIGVKETPAARVAFFTRAFSAVWLVTVVFLLPAFFDASMNNSAVQAPEGFATTGLDRTVDPYHDANACDDGVVCSPIFLSLVASGVSLGPQTGLRATGFEQRFLRFIPPQVDLPPPRSIV